MKISIVSPVYNEELNIEEFVRRSVQAISLITDVFELVLVNDCSSDRTKEILEKLKEETPQIRLLNLSRNSGQHAATVIGLKEASGDLVFLLDSDLQDPPEEMATLYKLGQEQGEWEIISGCRVSRSSSLVRSLGSLVVSFLINLLTRNKMRDPGSTFLLMKKAAVEKICESEIFAQNIQILMGFLGFRILEVEIQYNIEEARKSSYKIRDLVELIILAILNFTTGRMTMMALLLFGTLMIAFGTLAILYLIIDGIVSQSRLPTNFLLFFSINVVVGVQFLFLGVIAYKLERINKNLAFRKTLHCMIDE